MGLKDIKIPADASDKQTTDTRSALPPLEFTVVKGATSNVLAIHDRLAPQDRAPTSSYRIYFLPEAFAPKSVGTTATVPSSAVFNTVIRAAGKRVASLVTSVDAPSLGAILPASDTVNFGQKGYYYCVAVGRNGVESFPEHIVRAP